VDEKIIETFVIDLRDYYVVNGIGDYVEGFPYLSIFRKFIFFVNNSGKSMEKEVSARVTTTRLYPLKSLEGFTPVPPLVEGRMMFLIPSFSALAKASFKVSSVLEAPVSL